MSWNYHFDTPDDFTTEIFSKCLRNFSSNPRNVKVQSDFVKYLTPMHCVLPFLPFPSQQPGLSALNRKKPGKGRPQKKEGHGWLLLGQRKNGFAVLTFCIAVTTGTMHIDAFGPDLVQSRNNISFWISLCIYLTRIINEPWHCTLTPKYLFYLYFTYLVIHIKNKSDCLICHSR